MKQVTLATFTERESAANTWNDLARITLDAEIVALANGTWVTTHGNFFTVTDAPVLEFQGNGPVKIIIEDDWYFYGRPTKGATISIVARTQEKDSDDDKN